MLKVLRKYNKWVMVVFGSILMVSFLFTGASSQFQPDPRKQVLATVDGVKVRQMDFDLAQRELAALMDIVPRAVQLNYGIEDGTHWLLLGQEASRLGMVGDERDGLDWISTVSRGEAYSGMVAEYARQFGSVNIAEQIVRQQSQQVETRARELQIAIEAQKTTIATRHGLTDREFAVALSRLRGVDRLINLYGSSARQSDRRYIMAARRFEDSVIADAVIIAGESITDSIAEPAPDVLQAHFEKYRSVKPGEGDHGFGYVLPPRFKLEWILLSRGSVETSISLDPIAVNKHWQLNRTKYPGDFATEQANVEKDLRDTKIASVMEEADRVFKSRVRAITARLPVDGIYRKLPATWDIDAPKLSEMAMAMAEAVQTSSGVTMPPPMVSRPITEWTSLPDLENLGGIGGASIRMAGGTMDFAQLVSLAKEISPQVTIDLQARVPFTTFTLEDTAGNRYYFVINDIKPEAPAETLDEVRDQVIKDVKTLLAYEKLVNEKDKWVAKAAADGLDVVASSFRKPGGAPGSEPLPLEVVKDISISRDAARNNQLNEESVRESVVTAAELLGPLFVASPENSANRTLAEPLPKQLSLAVIQINRKELLAREDLLSRPSQYSRQLVGFELSEIRQAQNAGGPFSTDALKARLNYVEKGSKAPAKTTPTTDEKPTEKTAP